MLEKYKTRTSAAFDPAQPLVAGRRMTVQGNDLEAGDPLPDDLDNGVKRRLWLVRRAHYKQDFRPTPVDETVQTAPGEQDPNLEPDDAWMATADGVTVTAGDNGWYEIAADWLEEPVKAHGLEAAQEKAAELRETRGFTSKHVGGGKYEITGPGLTEPESVKGKDAAESRVAELRAAPPPAKPDEGSTSETGAGDDTEE
jgi:hypothetical protein